MRDVVYFARSGNLVKIGHSIQTEKRLAQLRTGSGQRLDLLGTIPGGPAREREIHKQWARLRVPGTEYFRATPDLMAFIARQLRPEPTPEQRRQMAEAWEVVRQNLGN